MLGFSDGLTTVQLTLGPYVYLTLIWEQRYALNLGMHPQLLFHLNASGGYAPGVALNLLAIFCVVLLLIIEVPSKAMPETPKLAPAPAESDVDNTT